MRRTREEKLLDPVPGDKIAAAGEYGIDLTQIVENLRLSPAQRIKRNDQAVNSMQKFEAAMRKTKEAAKARKDQW